MGSFNLKRMAKVTAMLVILAAVVAGSKFGYNYLVVNGPLITEARHLDARLEQAKKVGLAVSTADVETEERKKAIALHEPFLAFDTFLVNYRDIVDDERNPERLINLLADNPGQLQNLIAASEMPNVDTPIDWEGGLATSPPSYVSYNRYVAVACTLARYNADRNNFGETAKYLNVAAKLTRHLVDEPSTAAVISWTSCANRILRTSLGVIESAPKNAKLLADVRDVVDLVQPPTSLATAIKGDCLLFLVTARNFESMGPDKQRALQLSDENKSINPPEGRFAGKALESKSLNYWISSMEFASPKDGNVKNAGYVIDELGAQWVLEDSPANYLAGALPMTYEQMGTSIMRVSQIKSLVMSAASVIAKWQQSGSLPSELSNDDPFSLDPMTGRPFMYKPGPGRFVLQAIGDKEPAKAQPPIGNLRMVQDQGYGLTLKLASS